MIVSNWSPAALQPDPTVARLQRGELGSKGLRLALATAGAESPGPPGSTRVPAPRRPGLGTARQSTLLPSVTGQALRHSVLQQLHKVEVAHFCSYVLRGGTGGLRTLTRQGAQSRLLLACLLPLPASQRPLQLFAKSAPLSKVPRCANPTVLSPPPTPPRGLSPEVTEGPTTQPARPGVGLLPRPPVRTPAPPSPTATRTHGAMTGCTEQAQAVTPVPPSSWHTVPHTLSTGEGSLQQPRPPGTRLGWAAPLRCTHLSVPTSLHRNRKPARLHPTPHDRPTNSKGRAFPSAPLSQPGVCIPDRTSHSDGDRPHVPQPIQETVPTHG